MSTVPVQAPAPSLQAGTHLHQAVPGNHPHPGKWKVCPVGDRWGAFQPWAGSVYWLRLFDTFKLASDFVRDATAKAARTH